MLCSVMARRDANFENMPIASVSQVHYQCGMRMSAGRGFGQLPGECQSEHNAQVSATNPEFVGMKDNIFPMFAGSGMMAK